MSLAPLAPFRTAFEPLGSQPRGSIETHSRPRLLAATRHGFAFYVADPVSAIREQAMWK